MGVAKERASDMVLDDDSRLRQFGGHLRSEAFPITAC